jgi:hypothetical protein
MATNSTKTAVEMIASVSKGRGCSLPQEVNISVTQKYKQGITEDPMNDSFIIFPLYFRATDGSMWFYPFREFLGQDVIFYNNLHKLEAPWNPSNNVDIPKKYSINRLAEGNQERRGRKKRKERKRIKFLPSLEFIGTLQNDFSQTVPVLLRTAQRLAIPTKRTDPNFTCPLCGW